MSDQQPQALHPAFPYRLDPVHGIAQAVQGTEQEVAGTGMSILFTPQGAHDSVPELGMPDGAWRYTSVQQAADEIRDATRPFDPRVSTLADGTLQQLALTMQAVVGRG